MTTRGIRGAITIESDSAENVLSATGELLDAILESNPDLTAGGYIFSTVHSPKISHQPSPRLLPVKWAGIWSR